MGVRVSKRYNKDGSVTKTTTVSRKTVFGNTKSETFSERIPPKETSEKKKHRWWIWIIVGILAIAYFASKK